MYTYIFSRFANRSRGATSTERALRKKEKCYYFTIMLQTILKHSGSSKIVK